MSGNLPVLGPPPGPDDGSNKSGSNLNVASQKSAGQSSGDALLDAPEHVLSTLEKDGSRRWLRPKLSLGPWWYRRRNLAYVLMVVFVVMPHLTISGRPFIRLDIIARRFTIFGHTFLPTDTLLLALTMLTAFISIVLVTAVAGRAWCGWGCPQTVYMEYLFRPIDRLFEGTAGKGGKPKTEMSGGKQIARFAIYVLINAFLAHTFLSYFVGADQLATWIMGSPLNHPVAFAVMATTTGLLTYDFYYFREQTCLIACPYGRFQSVMLDRQSIIVAYDPQRGEPRKKGKRPSADRAGDCVDCNQCVVVCPTGIDIRDGLQMECINCTQCIDACDSVMSKVGLPQGLIRFSSQDGLEGKKPKFLRARTLLYPLILVAVASGLVYAISTKYSFDARIIRGKGAPFTRVERTLVSNSFSLRLVNRSEQTQTYSVSVAEPDGVTVEVIDDAGLTLDAGQTSLVPLELRFSSSLTIGDGNAPVQLKIADGNNTDQLLDFRLLGPR